MYIVSYSSYVHICCQVTATITKVKEYVTALGRLGLDGTEYALLRAIAIFGAGTAVHYAVILKERKKYLRNFSGEVAKNITIMGSFWVSLKGVSHDR